MAAVPVVEEAKMLSEALSTVKIQVQQMKRHLELDQLMDALKSASLMLAELRTSSLSPKQYYELYMAVFDALRHLSNYLYDAHTQSRHHLADLYELVQYAGNIIPRLYLMITVGSVYMSIPEAPVKEIMKDMMEMSRGVLHPIRGLFLRHYLSGQTRDHLPIGVDAGPMGNLQDSITFVLTNFIEMNKLWVRLQHQGHSRDREKREMERRELRILVGTNLVRLSQLDGVDLAMYQSTILPSILEQVVSCKDVIAQEYLMEVVIQVFTDEFHLHSLGAFLGAVKGLNGGVSIKGIVIALIDRLAAYAAREAENEDPEVTRKQEEEAARRLADRVSAANANGYPRPELQQQQSITPPEADAWGESSSVSDTPTTAVSEQETSETAVEENAPKPAAIIPEAGPPAEPEAVKKFRGVPVNVQLFEVFWRQVVELIKARPDLSIQDITALLVSLTHLSLSCYPDRLEYIDQLLSFTSSHLFPSNSAQPSPDLHSPTTTANLLSLLVAPITSYQSVLTLLAIPSYAPLLTRMGYGVRRKIACEVVGSVLRNETRVADVGGVSGVLGLCGVLIRDEETEVNGAVGRKQGYVEKEGMVEEQGWVARMVHLFKADDLAVQFELLQTARRHFDAGGERMRYTFPALITSAIKLCRRYKLRSHLEPNWKSQTQTILKFARQLTSILATQIDSPALALRLFLLAAQISDECGFADLTYDFYVQAFTVYEESISESRAQLGGVVLIVGCLVGARVGGKKKKIAATENGESTEEQEEDGALGDEDYDTLCAKAALHGAKLLKKSHQGTAVGLASHLWWRDSEADSDEKPAVDSAAPVVKDLGVTFPDAKRVLECLQKSLRIATSVTEEIITVQMYCDTLDHYLYYLDRGVPAVAPKFVNSLVELITSSIDNISSPNIHPSQRAPPGLVEGVQTPEMIARHFRNTLGYIVRRKNLAAAEGESTVDPRWEQVDVVGALLKMGIRS